MPQPLPRAYRLKLQAEDSAKVARIVGAVDDAAVIQSAAGATAAGDRRRLRGIPVVGRSTAGGAIPGTDPVRALLANEGQKCGALGGSRAPEAAARSV